MWSSVYTIESGGVEGLVGALDLLDAGRERAQAAIGAQHRRGVVDGVPRRRKIQEHGIGPYARMQ
jgi:hypothetical protein